MDWTSPAMRGCFPVACVPRALVDTASVICDNSLWCLRSTDRVRIPTVMVTGWLGWSQERHTGDLLRLSWDSGYDWDAWNQGPCMQEIKPFYLFLFASSWLLVVLCSSINNSRTLVKEWRPTGKSVKVTKLCITYYRTAHCDGSDGSEEINIKNNKQ